MKNTIYFMEAYYTKCFKAYGFTVKEAFGCKYAKSGISAPLFNGVIESNILDKDVTEAVIFFDQYYKNLGLPYCWWVDCSQKSSVLDNALKEVGLTPYEGFSGWFLDIDSTNSIEQSTRIDISLLDSEEETFEWGENILKAFDMPDSLMKDFSTIHLPARTKDNFNHLKAVLKDRIVTTGSVLFDERSAYFYNLSTAQNYRNKGYATAMIFERVRLAREKGCKYVFIRSSRLSGSIYKKLGFKEISKYKIYF